MEIWFYALASVLAISLVSLVGLITLAMREKVVEKISIFLVGLAVGALLGSAFIHLIPHSFEHLGHKLSTSLLIISGVLLFFILEKFIRWRHCHVSDHEHHIHPVVAMNLLGDGVHNMIDGMLIAAAYTIGFSEGLAVTMGILIHEIPQEIADFGVLVYGGLSVFKALLYNFITALTSVLGAIMVLLLPESKSLSLFLMPITAGCFLYIAGSDLVPELHHEVKISTSLAQLTAIILGVAIMALFAVFIPE